ncbi:MAG TPA: Mur ligase domain-containing protein, partial [Acidimicrobiia bacterium]
MTPNDAGSVPRPAGDRPLTLADLTDLVGAPVAGSDGDSPVISGVTLSSAEVRAGDLYAALPGARTHGARFAADAVRAGAVAVLTDAEGRLLLRDVDVPVVVVSDARAVAGPVAGWVYGEPSAGLRLVGITGTNGKTT